VDDEDRRAREEWKQALAHPPPHATTRTPVERQRGWAMVVAALCAAGSAVLWIVLAASLFRRPARSDFSIAASLAVGVFWGVRWLLRPKTIYEEEPRRK
jgi:hypothetical protein